MKDVPSSTGTANLYTSPKKTRICGSSIGTPRATVLKIDNIQSVALLNCFLFWLNCAVPLCAQHMVYG